MVWSMDEKDKDARILEAFKIVWKTMADIHVELQGIGEDAAFMIFSAGVANADHKLGSGSHALPCSDGDPCHALYVTNPMGYNL